MWGQGTGFIWTNPNTGIWTCGFYYVSEVRVDDGGFKAYIIRNVQREKKILDKYIFQVPLRYAIRDLN